MLDIVEVAGTLIGFICVIFFIRQSIYAWPAAIVSAALFGVVFFDAGLYANMGLQGVFIALSFYGLHQWRCGGPVREGVVVQRLRVHHSIALGTLVLVVAVVLIAVLTFAVQGAPVTVGTVIAFAAAEKARSLDALATAMSLAGTWLQANKFLANWTVWIATDVLLAGVFLSQELYFTTGLYLVYLAMAILGYCTWRKDLR